MIAYLILGALALESHGALATDRNDQCRNLQLGYNHFAHLRLVGFNSTMVGYLEVCENGSWLTATVRDGEWGRKEATVVCRELGFLDAITFTHIERQSKYLTPRWVHFDRVGCTGAESQLADCGMSRQVLENLSPSNLREQVMVLCNKNPISGTIRIVGGSEQSSEGILEVYDTHPSYRWSTVCSNSWTDIDASVACKQMGYTTGKSKLYSFSALGLPRRRYDYFNCNGSEDSLLQCQHNGPYPYRCGSAQYAGVICEGANSSEASCLLQVVLVVLISTVLILLILTIAVIYYVAKSIRKKQITDQHPPRYSRRIALNSFQLVQADGTNYTPPPSYEETLFISEEDTQPLADNVTHNIQDTTEHTVEVDSLHEDAGDGNN